MIFIKFNNKQKIYFSIQEQIFEEKSMQGLMSKLVIVFKVKRQSNNLS